MKMPSKIKEAWLKALRSGEYGQARGQLTNGKGGFCCLGVLQHVVSDGSCEVYPNDHYRRGQFQSLPSKEWYAENGIKLDAYNTTQGQLAEMNDGYNDWGGRRQKKFSTIANWIEKNIETTD